MTRFPVLDSTNRHVLAHLDALTDGQVIQADVQTAGRGRMSRKWVSEHPGNLCMTLVLKPAGTTHPAAMPLANLSQLLALSVCRALATYGAAATIRWPNDVLVGDRKIAGLLAETVVRGSRLAGMALGVGVNLNLDQTALAAIDQPATALCQWTGSAVRVDDFRDLVLEDFFGRRQDLMERGFPLIRDEFRSHCRFLGNGVEVRRHESAVCGIARDISADGALELLTADGELMAIGIGEMFAAP